MKKESISSSGNEHWKEHKAEHNRLVKLLPSTGETKENQLKIIRKQPMKINPRRRNKNLMFVWIEEEVQEVIVIV